MKPHPVMIISLLLLGPGSVGRAADPAPSQPVEEKGEGYSVPRIDLPPVAKHPLVSCTPEEVARLKTAYAGKGPEREVVARVVPPRPDWVNPSSSHLAAASTTSGTSARNARLAAEHSDDTHHQCPRCETIYSGEPYDDVIFEHGTMAICTRWCSGLGLCPYRRGAIRPFCGPGAGRLCRRYAISLSRLRPRPAAALLSPAVTSSSRRSTRPTLSPTNCACLRPHRQLEIAHDGDHRRSARDSCGPCWRTSTSTRPARATGRAGTTPPCSWGGAGVGDATWVRRAIEDPQNGFRSKCTLRSPTTACGTKIAGATTSTRSRPGSAR